MCCSCEPTAPSTEMFVRLSWNSCLERVLDHARAAASALRNAASGNYVTGFKAMVTYVHPTEQALLKLTKEDHPDREPLSRALEFVTEINGIVNSKKRHAERQEDMMKICEQIVGSSKVG